MFSLSFSGKVLARALPQTNAFCEIFVFSVEQLIKDGGGRGIEPLISGRGHLGYSTLNSTISAIFGILWNRRLFDRVNSLAL